MADRILRDKGWKLLERSAGSQEAYVIAEISVEVLRKGHEEPLSGAAAAQRAFQIG